MQYAAAALPSRRAFTTSPESDQAESAAPAIYERLDAKRGGCLKSDGFGKRPRALGAAAPA